MMINLLASFLVLALASGPVPKYGVALCQYQDVSVNVDFEFYIAKFQDSYDFKEMNGHTYYVSVTPEQEFILVGVSPLDSQGQVDSSKSAVGKGFNTITRESFSDRRGQQSLTCRSI